MNSTEPTSSTLTTPVLFIVFNRPEATQQVFDVIRNARPTRLYIAADGPRENKVGEKEKCNEVRKIASAVDWDCDVHTLFRDENLGCGQGPATAITWFFENETEGVILEDDCLPSPAFFSFCSELLERYRDDTRVMQIGGTNLEDSDLRDEQFSYRFSNLIYIWGWATWRRAWKLHDFNMNHYKELSEKRYLDESYNTIFERDFNNYIFEKMHTGDEKISSKTIWDYQWQFACKIHSGLIIVPNRNLVQNLGFGKDATNTLNPMGVGHNLKHEVMKFPLRHPTSMMLNQQMENHVFRKVCTNAISRVKSHLKNAIPSKVLNKLVKPILHLLS